MRWLLLALLLASPALAQSELATEKLRQEELKQKLQKVKSDIANLPLLTHQMEEKEKQLAALKKRRDALRKGKP